MRFSERNGREAIFNGSYEQKAAYISGLVSTANSANTSRTHLIMELSVLRAKSTALLIASRRYCSVPIKSDF